MTVRILLIDNDTEHTGALKTYLERIQYEVTPVSHSDEILEHLQQSSWDIVLGNPLIDEIVADQLDQMTRNTPPFQLIVYGRPDQIDFAMDRFDLRVIHYHTLPINGKALELSLKRAIKQQNQFHKFKRYTERMADLHTAQNLFNQLFDEVPCYISVQNKDLRITATNKRFKRHFGNAIGGYCYELYKHRSVPCEACPVVETFKDGKIRSTEEIVTSISGKQYNVLTHTAPIRDETGQITQVMEMSTNITQIRQLQDHLTSLGLMLGSMSHGVKGMLTALDGGVYQLETGLRNKDEQRTLKAFDQIKTMSDKIKKMVLEILYYAKSRDHQFRQIRIKDFLKNVMGSIQPMAKKNKVTLELEGYFAGTMELDPSWMESALVNFLENAIEACSFDQKKTDHHVCFTVSEESSGMIRFVIKDNGMGMDQETREKMFTLFFTSKGSQGTGLGMFIANRVIKQHGGSVEVTSEPDLGTTMIIRLPRFQELSQDPANDFPIDPGHKGLKNPA